LLKGVTINNKLTTLAEYYLQFNNLKENYNNSKEIMNFHFTPNIDRNNFTNEQTILLKNIFSNILKYNLNITQKDKKVSIYSLDVVSEDEIFSKTFCETLASEISIFYIETKSKKSRINVDILQKQSDSIRAELNNSIDGLASSIDHVYNLNPSLNINRTPTSKRQIDVQANTAILQQLLANLEISKVSLRKETPLIQIIDRPILPLDKSKVSPVKIGLFSMIVVVILTIFYISIAHNFKNNYL
jgi:hypothetical protein